MHEVSLMQNVFELIDDYSREYKLAKVTKVVLRIGEMSCVSHDSLEFAFSAISKDTIAEQAEFLIERVPGRSQCTACSHEFESSLLNAICPLCEKPAMCVAGRELHLQSLEGTKEES